MDIEIRECRDEDEAEWVRSKVMHFVITGLLGKGGMGKVDRLNTTKLRRKAAITVMS